MDYFVYVLLNWDRKHWYVGSSQNIEIRLKHHNSGHTFSTKPYRPWKIVHLEKFNSRKEAVNREVYLKSPSGYQEYLTIKKSIFIDNL